MMKNYERVLSTLKTKEDANNGNSPSQKIQSHEQRKQVVARGLLHLLHERFDAAGGRPLELPGGIPADERMDIPVPTRDTIPDVDMVNGNIFSIDGHEEEKTD